MATLSSLAAILLMGVDCDELVVSAFVAIDQHRR